MSARSFKVGPELHLIAKDERGDTRDYVFRAPVVTLNLSGEAALLINAFETLGEMLQIMTPRLQLRTSRLGGFTAVPFQLIATKKPEAEDQDSPKPGSEPK